MIKLTFTLLFKPISFLLILTHSLIRSLAHSSFSIKNARRYYARSYTYIYYLYFVFNFTAINKLFQFKWKILTILDTLFVCLFSFFSLFAIDISKSFISFGLTEITCIYLWNCSFANKHSKYIFIHIYFWIWLSYMCIRVGCSWVFIPFAQHRGAGTIWQMVLSWKDVHKIRIRMC